MLAAFQGNVNQALRECLDLFYIAYLDDIVVCSKMHKKYIMHFEQLLERSKAARLYLKLTKYQFYAKQIGFIRFINTPDSFQMKPNCI
jgi:hypothetical protein